MKSSTIMLSCGQLHVVKVGPVPDNQCLTAIDSAECVRDEGAVSAYSVRRWRVAEVCTVEGRTRCVSYASLGQLQLRKRNVDVVQRVQERCGTSNQSSACSIPQCGRHFAARAVA